MKRRTRRSKACRGLGRAARQISCQGCVVVLYLFSQPSRRRSPSRSSVFEPKRFGRRKSRRGRALRQNGVRPEMAPQQVEKIEFAPGNGMVPEAANPQDVVDGRAADRARLRKNDKVAKVAEKGAQGFEIARCKTEIGACRRRKRRASSLARDRPAASISLSGKRNPC